uniref:Reticulon n=1 Tax=Echeneis naucrates TaxID=173247 RepID=A0A665U8G9_ECHNA
MADSDERQVSSTTPLFSEGIHHYQAEMDPEPDQPKQNLFSVDDIVDLVGGAQDALERHIAEDSAPHEVTETPLAPISEPTLIFSGESQVVSPKAEPERTNITPEPETAPQRDALPAAGLRKTAPAPAEAAQRPAVKEDSPTPATLVDLLYWRDVKTTGVVFGAALLLLLSLTVCSIVSVCSYVGLALLSVTICFRIYKGILQAIQKSDEGHPFKQYLDQEVALSDDMVHKYSDMALAKINKTIGELRRLFLVEDLVDSIKFAVLMWILTYVGALFNGLTLLILGLIGAFSCPIVYEKHQAQIDHYLSLVNNQVKEVVGKIQAKVPGMKRKAE